MRAEVVNEDVPIRIVKKWKIDYFIFGVKTLVFGLETVELWVGDSFYCDNRV